MALGSRLAALVVCTALAAALVLRQRGGNESGASSAVPELQTGKFERVRCARQPSGSPPPVAGCTPRREECGRLFVEGFASPEEVAALRDIAERGMAIGGGSGGPTILDLQTGALSFEDKFVDVWLALNATGRRPYSKSDVKAYADVASRAAALLEREFAADGLQLTAPTFFSRIRADRPPVIANDEYWHSHVDTLQYGSFVFTTLLYLSDAETDFEGGDFVFEEAGDRPAARVAPRRGRLVAFSSGSEFPHHVEQVTQGVRLALTIAFTCTADAAIDGFLSRAVDDNEATRIQAEIDS